jgi:preprotein translocase SecF subunit
MVNIVQRRRWFFIFSGILLVISLISMGISVAQYPERSPVRLSIDFIGGSLLELEFKPIAGKQPTGTISEGEIIAVFEQFGLRDPRVQRLQQITDTTDTGTASPAANAAAASGATRWQVRTSDADTETTDKLQAALNTMAEAKGYQLDREAIRISQVSPAVGGEVTRAAFIAVVVASIIVLGFIGVAFRRIRDSFRYGVCAVLAMIHDVLIMTGAMSLMGLLFGWEADALFLTALLTVVAWSVQDTIVVFDRIRENSMRHRGEPYEMIVNRSILETFQRSISMQVVVAFVLVALFLIGGDTIRQFVGVLLIGLLSGTYSSTFVAIPLLVAWDEGQLPLVNRAAARA